MLHDLLAVHLVQRWRGRHQRYTYDNTTYWAGRKARNGLVLYSDKPCRWTRWPFCAHLELRCNGMAALRAKGIKSIDDLLAFDHRAFWERHLQLRAVNRPRPAWPSPARHQEARSVAPTNSPGYAR